MTSLYQVTLRGKVVETVTLKKKKVKRWFYIDIRQSLDPFIDREDAIVGVPEDRIVRPAFGRETILDLSSAEREYASFMYPVWDKWQDGFDKHWRGDENECIRDEFRTFKKQVLENFTMYRVPVIALDRSTSKEAVCVVFEKVNTGGNYLTGRTASLEVLHHPTTLLNWKQVMRQPRQLSPGNLMSISALI